MKNSLNLKWDSVSYAYLNIMKMREKDCFTKDLYIISAHCILPSLVDLEVSNGVLDK